MFAIDFLLAFVWIVLAYHLGASDGFLIGGSIICGFKILSDVLDSKLKKKEE
jgi:hypothetical protein